MYHFAKELTTNSLLSGIGRCLLACVLVAGLIPTYAIANPAVEQEVARDSATVPTTRSSSYDNRVKRIYLGEYTGAAIMDDGSLWTWGAAPLGDNTATGDVRPIPKRVLENVVQVSLTRDRIHALKSDGSLWVSGSDALNAEYTDSGTVLKYECLDFQKIMDGVKSVDSEGYNGITTVLTENGEILTWGYNHGSNPVSDSSIKPCKIMDNAVSMWADEGRGAAVTQDGSFYTWGWGVPGDGTAPDPSSFRFEPTRIETQLPVRSFAAGASQLYVTENNELWMWGRQNMSYPVFDAAHHEEVVYTPFKRMDNVIKADTGAELACAIKTDNTLWTWGINNNNLAQSSTPTQVMENVTDVSVGDLYAIAVVKNDGTAWTWGGNQYGQLGVGDCIDHDTPVQLHFTDDTTSDPSKVENEQGVFNINFLSTTEQSVVNGETHPVSYPVYWDDAWFDQQSTKYNPQLATASSALAMAAYNNAPSEDPKKDCIYIRESFAALGFDTGEGDVDVSSYTHRLQGKSIKEDSDSDYKESIDLVAYAFGKKKFLDASGQEQDLIIVAVRGTPSNIEWVSNAQIDYNDGIDVKYHAGFKYAETELLGKLIEYLQKNRIDDRNARILITGHSRGAAVANLLAADLSFGLSTHFNTSRVYAYTFATPATTTKTMVHRNTYDNIFNFVNPEDFVPRVPLKKWGFERFGKTFYLPTRGTQHLLFTKLESRVQAEYQTYSGITYVPFETVGPTDKFVSDAENLAPTVQDFYKQKHYAPIVKGMTFHKYFEMLTSYLAEGEEGKPVPLLILSLGSYCPVFWYFVRYNVFDGLVGDHKEELEDVVDGDPILNLTLSAQLAAERLLIAADENAENNVFFAHTPDTYVYWTHALQEYDITPLKQGQLCDTKKAVFYCPVDLEVRDASGNVVARIVNNQVDEVLMSADASVSAYVDSEIGAKYLWIPTDQNYTIACKATETVDSGLDITWSSHDFEGADYQQKVYNDLDLVKGESYQLRSYPDAQVSNVFVDTVEIIGNDGMVVNESYVVDEASGEALSVEVEVVGNGDAVGVASATKGDHVTAYAYAHEKATFKGWFENGANYQTDVPVSTDIAYTFRIDENRSLVAVFLEDEGGSSSGEDENPGGTEGDSGSSGDTGSPDSSADAGANTNVSISSNQDGNADSSNNSAKATITAETGDRLPDVVYLLLVIIVCAAVVLGCCARKEARRFAKHQ
ncbi:hypothetical protein [Adlercreutzia sp. ZJ138]|uniref:lipase family protein n=1 Tax=Adlercreutzia sp. ZJ138 TaxID=2709405 RepID=UPI0013EB9F1B|nr:hypothetical protein [Adlercreutzia sp. ZJ138]